MPNSSNNDLTYAVQSTPLSVLGKLTVTAWFCQLWLQFRSSSILKMCLYTWPALAQTYTGDTV